MKAHIKKPTDIKISACTITKNEEKTIAKSIKSYREYVDEIIVTDTGSTDNTVKIAEDLGAKVLHYEWNNDFASAKNTGIDAATGDWIICLDADEYFTEDTCKNLRYVINQAELQGKSAIGCRMDNIDIDNGISIAETFSIRVFKKGTRYQFPIHEEIYNPNGGITVLTVDKSCFYLGHTGYSSKIAEKKCKRNLEIMFDELEKVKDDNRKIIYYSYISDAYFGIKDYDKAIEYAKMYMVKAKINNLRILGCEVKPYLNIIQSLKAKNADDSEIDPYINQFEKKFPDCPDAVCYSAISTLNRHLYKKALDKFKCGIKISENYSGTFLNGVAKSKALIFNNMGVCEESMHNIEAALEWYFKGSCEPLNYERPLFNLFRIIKNMPDNNVSNFAEAIYINAGEKKHIAVMSALMSNYMTDQLVKCYADYRTKKSENALYSDVTAYIMAGKGSYIAAANIFLLNFKSNQNKSTAMRALLCAVLSKDKEAIDNAVSVAEPEYVYALGLSAKPELSHESVNLIAEVLSECVRIGEVNYAVKRIDSLANELDDSQMFKLSKYFESNCEYEPAFAVAQHCGITKDSVYLQGRLLYKLGRFNESSDILHLAKHMGCTEEALEVLLNDIQRLRKQNVKITAEEQKNLKFRIENEMNDGNFDLAAQDILKYKQSAEPDEEILTAEATLLFYCGNYKKAAIAVEAGLLKNGKSFDLLYNAGCIYEKLEDLSRAKNMFELALKHCSNEEAAQDIRQSLSLINENSGR